MKSITSPLLELKSVTDKHIPCKCPEWNQSHSLFGISFKLKVKGGGAGERGGGARNGGTDLKLRILMVFQQLFLLCNVFYN